VRLCEGRFPVILLNPGLPTKDDGLLVVQGIAEHHIGASISLEGVILKEKISVDTARGRFRIILIR
jgi:hypothetical protein